MRVIVVYVPEDQLLELFDRQSSDNEYVHLPIMATAIDQKAGRIFIPRDRVVERCFYSPERRAFGYLLSHPHFADVPHGECPPTFVFKEVTFRLRQKADEQLIAERDKLQKFKDWVHEYLDNHGVPHHPLGTHGAAGCRIGDRMDWLFQEYVRKT